MRSGRINRIGQAGVVLLAVLAATAAVAADRSAQSDYGAPLTGRYSQAALLKNYALSACLADITTDAHLKQEARLAANGYMQFGHQGLEAYETLRAEAKRALSVKATGSVEGDFTVMQCIDFYNSAHLDQVVRGLLTPARGAKRAR